MLALNFYSPLLAAALRDGTKTLTVRLGDKRDKYRDGQIVWVTVGHKYGTRQRIFTAVIDRVDTKLLRDVSPREIAKDNPAAREHTDLLEFLSTIYSRRVGLEDTVTLIHFSRITNAREE
ncbi:MAG TPA: ASCH domain-containing protein [bacterium]|nr:ASCH domain-containing protein [bacterium]